MPVTETEQNPAFDPFLAGVASTFERTVVHRLDMAILFAEGHGTRVRWRTEKTLVRLWRAAATLDTLDTLDAADSTRQQDHPTQRRRPSPGLLAVAQRNAGGRATIFVSRRVYAGDDLLLA